MTRVKGEQPETKCVSAFDNQELSSSFGSDVDGNEIDLSSQDHPTAMTLVVGASADMSTSSDNVQFNIEEKASGGTYSDTGDSVTIEDADAAGVVTKTFDLEGYKQKIRVYADSGNSSLAAATDFHVDAVLTGQDAIPQ